ncbi:hypothetical protein D3C86_1832860 [compost metagenome]
MARHGVLWHIEPAGDFAGGQAMGLMFDHEAESREARWLGQGREGLDDGCVIHISGFIDIL